MTRAASSQFSFADLEFLDQGVRLEPMLQAISDFIDGHGHLVDKVRRDLNRGLKNPHTGRTGLTAQQVLRSLVVSLSPTSPVTQTKVSVLERILHRPP